MLAAVNVSKRYNTYEGVFNSSDTSFLAVNNVSLTLKEGESIGIVGQSGCGKTTLAKILAGIISPEQGEVLYKGVPYKEAAEYRKNVQMVFQNPDQSLNPRLRVKSVLYDLLSMRYSGRREIYNESVRLMEMVGLSEDYLDRYPVELSGGQKQRVSIARSLALEPEVIIADEPVSGLDVSVQAQILNLLAELKGRGITYIFISHDLSVVSWLCDRVVVMYAGEIVEDGEVEAVMRSPKHEYTKKLMVLL
ncbi:MAG: ATP-binding cassette domain-containing protein [Deferribacteraceae bacterium]|jgi:ABC-type glutathione transport system ATPase component|nr:ATP-binding cassette domain-containing protein [Deferribacteraceae bacterium]